MNTQKIVITGGPSTGKTAVIEELGKKGFFCIPELVRSLTAAEKNDLGPNAIPVNPILSVKDPKKFNRQLLEGRISQYTSIGKMNRELVFFDRGIPDVHAYMNCFRQSYDEAFERPVHQFRYDKVLLMPPWREIFVTDGERFESYPESKRIFTSLEETYKHFGYNPILVPKGSVAERTDFILNLVLHRDAKKS